MIKGYEVSFNTQIIQGEQLRASQEENRRQTKKRARKQRFVAKGGCLTVTEGLAKIAVRDGPAVGGPAEGVLAGPGEGSPAEGGLAGPGEGGLAIASLDDARPAQDS
jgi:hypothetical protein